MSAEESKGAITIEELNAKISSMKHGIDNLWSAISADGKLTDARFRYICGKVVEINREPVDDGFFPDHEEVAPDWEKNDPKWYLGYVAIRWKKAKLLDELSEKNINKIY